MNIIKKIISKLYHKYVCRPTSVNITNMDDYLLYCEEVYKLKDDYTIDTFEQLNVFHDVVYSRFKMKKTAKSLIDKGFDKPVILGDKEYVKNFNQIFDELKK